MKASFFKTFTIAYNKCSWELRGNGRWQQWRTCWNRVCEIKKVTYRHRPRIGIKDDNMWAKRKPAVGEILRVQSTKKYRVNWLSLCGGYSPQRGFKPTVLFLCLETTGWTYMAVHFQMSGLISLCANRLRAFLLFLLPFPLVFPTSLSTSSDLSATISAPSHQRLISCTGRTLVWIMLEAIYHYN